MQRPQNPMLLGDRSVRKKVVRHSCGKCQMCGRTASTHGISLVADQNPWAGSGANGSEALWAICLDCSAGLRAYFRSLKISPVTLRRVSSYESVHVRIGELLRAFGVGRRTPSSLIFFVADQPSWKSRLRELRQPPFCWDLAAACFKSPSGRVKCDYILVRESPWPGNSGRSR